MRLLILFSEPLRDENTRLQEALSGSAVEVVSQPLPPSWTLGGSESLLSQLRSCTHWLFLVSAADRGHPAFVFASGYCLAVGERAYAFDADGSVIPPSWGVSLTLVTERAGLPPLLLREHEDWQRRQGQAQARARLAEQGLDVTEAAFLSAVEQGDQASCGLFLRAGFSADLTNKKGVTVLGLAVRHAHPGVLRLLLDAGADVNQISKDRENSPVMDAAAEGHSDLVQDLIARGADLGGLSRNGQNALVLAIGKGAEQTANLLLAAGADPFVADKLGMNACQYAQLLGRTQFLEQVKARYPDRL